MLTQTKIIEIWEKLSSGEDLLGFKIVVNDDVEQVICINNECYTRKNDSCEWEPTKYIGDSELQKP